MKRRHDMPFGCELRGDGSARFRLWAPALENVTLEYGGGDADWRSVAMQSGADGWFESEVPACGAGSHYRYRLPDGMCVPDPASRYQPHGVHGPSEIIDPGAFDWRDSDWQGRPWQECIFYELHPGCFTPQGDYNGIRRQLDHLVELGVTALELMPLSQTPGQRNWGYDGAFAFAPNHCYGTPGELKSLIQSAHRRGLMVFVDVVYNHFGPEGNYLHLYAPGFFTERHDTPWGPAINYDGPGSGVVRRFFIDNALYWLEEYHIDGLRLDAVHSIRDDSQPDILEELAAAVRARTAPERHVHLVLENDHNAAHYLGRDGARPRLYDAQWNDDLHHAAHVLLTGEGGGYYQDYVNHPLRHLERCLREGFTYQGEYSAYRRRPRGEDSTVLPPAAFVNFLQNHDQVGNRAFGDRLSVLAPPEALRAMVAILLLSPPPPLLFMGEEWGTRRPFLYFCDFGDELAAAVREGRREEFRHFPAFSSSEGAQRIPDPNSAETFEACRLDWREPEAAPYRQMLELYRHLLALRNRELMPLLPHLTRGHRQNHADCGYLHITWQAGDLAQLQLLANPASAAVEAAPAKSSGGRLFETHARGAAALTRLPPWYVGWFIQRPGDPG